MKKPTLIFIIIILGFALLLAPLVSASGMSFGSSMITTDTEFYGDAVLNETTELKWSTGADTYEWKESSSQNNATRQKTQSVLNTRQENGSIRWSFQKNGYNLPSQTPINQYIDDRTIMKPQNRFSYSKIQFMPGIQLF
ncbi:MAG: hypothetical protein WCP36_00435 [Methanomicrobiales archaeon]